MHATLRDSAIDAYRRFVGALSVPEVETYYEEMKQVAAVFGLPASAIQVTWPDFRVYFDDTIATMRMSKVSQTLATDIVDPPLPLVAKVPLAPAIAFHRLVAVGMTPLRVRDGPRFALERGRTMGAR